MAEITAAFVKELRDKSGAGMMDCKKALVENNGDMEAASDWLRAKGLAKAAKKAGRVAADGLVAALASEDGKTGVLVELNAETDFVARNETFQDALSDLTKLALSIDGDVEALKAAPATSGDGSVEDQIGRLIANIGENISLRRMERVQVGSGAIASYIHSSVADGLGKIGVLIALESDADRSLLEDLGRKLAMHVAATSPLSLSTESLDDDIVARERQVLAEQARESGKPDNVIEKMIEGRMRKYFKEVVLLEQDFVMNPDQTVMQFISESAKAAGSDITLAGFARYVLGEGIEKEEADFAAEVAAATGQG